MGQKFDQHILDPFLNPIITDNFKNVEQYKDLASKTYINEPLAQFGQQEQQKIFDGNIGSTMLAKTARNQGSRDIRALKESQALGGAALARAGNNSSSFASVMYDRMLNKETGRVNDRTAEMVTGGLPGYTDAAAGWAEAGNRGREQQMQMGQQYQGMLSNAVGMRQSNQTFEKKKSLWDKIKEGVAVAGNIAGIVSGVGAMMPMNSGGGTAQPQKVGTASRGGYSGYY